jgi:hypothetical protein
VFLCAPLDLYVSGAILVCLWILRLSRLQSLSLVPIALSDQGTDPNQDWATALRWTQQCNTNLQHRATEQQCGSQEGAFMHKRAILAPSTELVSDACHCTSRGSGSNKVLQQTCQGPSAHSVELW